MVFLARLLMVISAWGPWEVNFRLWSAWSTEFGNCAAMHCPDIPCPDMPLSLAVMKAFRFKIFSVTWGLRDKIWPIYFRANSQKTFNVWLIMGEVISMVLIFTWIRDAHIYLVFTQTTRDFEKKIFKNMNQEMELFWLILRT